jgi:hypothetical protein
MPSVDRFVPCGDVEAPLNCLIISSIDLFMACGDSGAPLGGFIGRVN